MKSATLPAPVRFEPYRKQRRLAGRSQATGTALLFDGGQPARTPGQCVEMFDLSLSGVGFRSARALAVGSIHRFQFDGPALHLTTRVKVTRCSRGADGAFTLGAQFVEE